MSNINKRLNNLENHTDDETVIVVDWGGPTINVKGVEMTRAEFDKHFPDRKVVEWEDDEPGGE